MRYASLLVLPLLLLGACNNDAAKKTTEGPKKPEAIPDDLVVNEFFPEKGGGRVARALVDASLPEGGLGEAVAATGDSGSADDSDAVEERKLTVIDAGAEPRAPRRYAFKTPTEARKFVSIQKSVREAQGQKQEDSQPPTTVNLVFTLKGQSGGVFHYVALLKSVDIDLPANIDKRAAAQAKQATAALAGITAAVDVTARGSVGEVKFMGDKVPRGAAQQVLPLISQIFEFLVAPLPEEPIGVGAKWQSVMDVTEQGMRSKMTVTYTLKDWNADGGVIETTTVRTTPKQPMQDPRMGNASVSIDGKGSSRFELKTGGLATKSGGDNAEVVNVEAPGPSGRPETALVQTSQVKYTLEIPH